jgi:hypothetical protein
MQNAQNLMSSFQFIAALMSIIIGLGVTNLLAGAGRLDHYALPAYRFSLSAGSIRSGRTPAPLSTESGRLLFGVHQHVCARYRANRTSR